MAIDFNAIHDTDWLACTDTDGVTYKVSGANFKKLFPEPKTVPWEITTTTPNFKYYPFFVLSGENPITINWGDGSPKETITQTGVYPVISHTYSTPGTYSLTGTSKGPFCVSGGYAADVWASAEIVTSVGPPEAGHKLPPNCNYLNSKFKKIVDTTWSFIADFDFSDVENLMLGFTQCTTMESFPFVSLPNCTNFNQAWFKNDHLEDFPANMFDACPINISASPFVFVFYNCALTSQSIENVLASLDTNGASNCQLNIDSGSNAEKTTWTPAANTAYDNLTTKGWTILYNA